MENKLYPDKYGDWAGNPNGHKPDYNRCCFEVTSTERWARQYQCNRKRGHGPDKAYCKIHDPAAVKARRNAQDDKWDREFNARRYEIHGRKFYDTLKLIAMGHNDARGLAKLVLDEFDAGARKVREPNS